MANTPSTPLNFHLRACREGNYKLLESAFILGGRFLGTDDSEKWYTNYLIQLLRENPEGWTMRLRSRKLYSVSQEVYEFCEFLDHKTYGPFRGSGLVIVDTDKRWKILSYYMSCSVPNHALEGDSLSRYLMLIKAAQ
jgi:hypothetical protein